MNLAEACPPNRDAIGSVGADTVSDARGEVLVFQEDPRPLGS